MPKIVHNPHDAFIAKILKQKSEAVSFIKGVVPEDMKQNIRFDSLTLSPDTYMNKVMRKNYSDIVYEANYINNTPLKVVFIIEHKSFAPSINIKLQLMEYFIGVVNLQISQDIKPLAIPVMIVLYHGAKHLANEPLWKIFGEVQAEMQKFIPDFEFILCDLQDFDDGKIKEVFDSFQLRATFLTLRDIFNDERFEKSFRTSLNEILQILDTETEVAFLSTLLTYIEAISDKKVSIAEDLIKKLKTKGGNTMNIIDAAIQKGKREGKIEGKLEGIQLGEYKKALRTGVKVIQAGLEDVVVAEFAELKLLDVQLLRSKYDELGDKIFDWIENFVTNGTK